MHISYKGVLICKQQLINQLADEHGLFIYAFKLTYIPKMLLVI